MKVLMTTDAVGGVWTYALDLARGLAAAETNVVLAVMGPAPRAEQLAQAAKVPGLVVEHRPYRLEWMQDPWEDVQAAGQWLRALEAKHRVDIVHLNGYAHAVVPFQAPVVVVAHSCVYGWHESVQGTLPSGEWERYRAAVRAGLAAADLIVAPTKAMQASLQRFYGPLDTRIVRIANGRIPYVTPQRPKDPSVLWVGRVWDAAKDVRLLDVAAEGLPWQVVAAGDPAHPEGGQAAPLANVDTVGHLPDDELRGAYARASIFVSTAKYEPFGLSVLEAAQAGCALVLPAIESLKETWAGSALFYRPGDAASLRSRLDRLIEDPVTRERLAAAARRRAMLQTARRMATDYLARYRRMTDQHAAEQEVVARAS